MANIKRKDDVMNIGHAMWAMPSMTWFWKHSAGPFPMGIPQALSMGQYDWVVRLSRKSGFGQMHRYRGTLAVVP
jgi:hypothetical protein